MLDAGCGTGQRAKALLDLGIGKVTLLDASPEMLALAEKKLHYAIEDKRVESIAEATLPYFPFGDRTFDVVMFNQV